MKLKSYRITMYLCGATLCGATWPLLLGIASCGEEKKPSISDAPIVLRVDVRNAENATSIQGDLQFRLCTAPNSCRPAADSEEKSGVFRLSSATKRAVVHVEKPGFAPATAVADFTGVELAAGQVLEAKATAMLLAIPAAYEKEIDCASGDPSFSADGLRVEVPAGSCSGKLRIRVAMSKVHHPLRAAPGPLERWEDVGKRAEPLLMLSMVHISILGQDGIEIKDIKPIVSFPSLIDDPKTWPEDIVLEGPTANGKDISVLNYNETSGFWEDAPGVGMVEIQDPLVKRNIQGEILAKSAVWRVQLPHLSWWGIFKKKETHCTYVFVRDPITDAGVPNYPVGAQGISFVGMMLAKYTKGGADPGHACIELPMGHKSQIFLGYPFDPGTPMPAPLVDVDLSNTTSGQHCNGHGENQPECHDAGVLDLPGELCGKASEGMEKNCALAADSGVGMPCKQVCNSGIWGPCEQPNGISAEICDGVDNDCNGWVDDLQQVAWDCNTVKCDMNGNVIYEKAPADYKPNGCISGCVDDPNSDAGASIPVEVPNNTKPSGFCQDPYTFCCDPNAGTICCNGGCVVDTMCP